MKAARTQLENGCHCWLVQQCNCTLSALHCWTSQQWHTSHTLHWCVVAVMMFATASGAGAAEIELRAGSRTGGSVVTLGHVANVLACDPEEARALGAVELFPVPPAGEERFVTVRQLQDLLYVRGISPVEHRFSGSSRVAISATGGATAVRVASAKADDVAVGKSSGSAPVVVAVRTLPRGSLIGKDDVRLEHQDVSSLSTDAIGAIENVIGREATRTVAAGKVLEVTSVQSPNLVRRGEIVSVCVRRPGIRVRSFARARDDGGLGDMIAVESTDDRRTFLVRVSGRREVEVHSRGERDLGTWGIGD